MNQDYRNIAPRYDLLAARFLAGPHRELVAALQGGSNTADLATKAATLGLADKANLTPPGPRTVLDIGCGTGLLLRKLTQAGFAATGLDRSPHMLAQARKKLDAATGCRAAKSAAFVPADISPTSAPEGEQTSPCAPVQPPRLLLGSAEALPFAGHSFDVATISLLLHECKPDLALRILGEAARVSRHLLLLDWKLPERNLDYLFHPPVRLIEGLHNRNFGAFMAAGGLEGLICRHNIANDNPRLNPGQNDHQRKPEQGSSTSGHELVITGRRFLRLGTMVLLDILTA